MNVLITHKRRFCTNSKTRFFAKTHTLPNFKNMKNDHEEMF